MKALYSLKAFNTASSMKWITTFIVRYKSYAHFYSYRSKYHCDQHRSYIHFILFYFIFFYLGILSRTVTNHRTTWEEGISLTTHCHFHPLHRHLDISQAITAKSSPPLHKASSRNLTGNACFPSASH